MVFLHHVSRKIELRIIAVFAVAAFAACGGGGGTGSPAGTHPLPPASAPGGTQLQASISVPASKTGVPIPLPTLPGVTGTVTLPASDAPPGTSITITTSATLPSFVVGTPESGSLIFLTITMTAEHDLTFERGGPQFAVTLSQPPANRGAYFAWRYNSVHAWQNFATLNVSGNTLRFGDSSTQMSLIGNVSDVIVPLTARASAGCPTPPPIQCPALPTTSSPMPPGAKLYLTGQTNSGHCPDISVSDANGNSLLTNGGFPGLTPFGVDYARVEGIAFDTFDRHLYVSEDLFFPDNSIGATIQVYDLNGKRVSTSGHFQGLTFAGPMMFDPLNRYIYVGDRYGDKGIQVYDENGNRIRTSGAFVTNSGSVRGITFDPDKRLIYAAICCYAIEVYDENGNHVTTSGTFPNIHYPEAIAFDPLNRRIYVGNASVADPITVYDEQGNQVTNVSFRGPTSGDRLAMAFDTSSGRIYILTTTDLEAFDESGSQIPISGSFFDPAQFMPESFVPVQGGP